VGANPISRTRRRVLGGKIRPAGLTPSAAVAPTGDPSRSLSNAPAHDRDTLEISIGRKIRALRQKLQLTGADLATEANISPGMLSKIENGGISPSLSTLQSLAEALNVPMTIFFADYEERRDCSFVKANTGVPIERRGTKAGHHYQLIGHSIAGDIAVEPYLIMLSEDAEPYTLFQHDGVEFIYMLTGRVAYRHADKAYLLEPGDALFFDCQAPHGPETLIEPPISYLSIIIYPRP
jgi:DNA-binding XRE family transcriptional regulator